LAQNRLKALPPEIGLLTELQGLSITHNELETLPKEVSAAACCRLIQTLCATSVQLYKLTKLEDLRMSYNRVAVLLPNVAHFTKLRWLSAAHNLLREIPVQIATLTCMQCATALALLLCCTNIISFERRISNRDCLSVFSLFCSAGRA